MQVDGVWKIAGVHDFSYCFDLHNCTFKFTFGQGGGDTSVYANRDWLNRCWRRPNRGLRSSLRLASLVSPSFTAAASEVS